MLRNKFFIAIIVISLAVALIYNRAFFFKRNKKIPKSETPVVGQQANFAQSPTEENKLIIEAPTISSEERDSYNVTTSEATTPTRSSQDLVGQSNDQYSSEWNERNPFLSKEEIKSLQKQRTPPQKPSFIPSEKKEKSPAPQIPSEAVRESLPAPDVIEPKASAPQNPPKLEEVAEEQLPVLTVNSILINGPRRIAVINGQIISEGEWVGKEQVLEIKLDGVVLGKDSKKRVIRPKQSSVPMIIRRGVIK
jgi:hypothetical protein